MRRIAIEKPDGSLLRFDSGKLVTFKNVSDARAWMASGERLKPVDVPDGWEDALVSGQRT